LLANVDDLAFATTLHGRDGRVTGDPLRSRHS